MNIEVKIVAPELAEALNNLAAAIAGRETTPATADPKPEKPKTPARAAVKTEAKIEPSTQPTSEPREDAGTSTTASDPGTDGSADETPAIDYADIKKAVVALSLKHGRAATVAVLAEFGVPEGGKADLVDEARWSELLARLTEEAAK